MQREEVVKLVRTMAAIFPNWKPMDLTDTADAWDLLLGDYSYQEIMLALQTYTKTTNSPYPPSIPQLIGMLYKADEYNESSEAEAWAMVRRAISRATYYAQEEFDNFPTTVQKAVGSASNLRMWAVDENFNEGVCQSNFLRAYRTQVERQREFQRMPIEMQKRIIELGASTGKKLIGGE